MGLLGFLIFLCSGRKYREELYDKQDNNIDFNNYSYQQDSQTACGVQLLGGDVLSKDYDNFTQVDGTLNTAKYTLPNSSEVEDRLEKRLGLGACCAVVSATALVLSIPSDGAIVRWPTGYIKMLQHHMGSALRALLKMLPVMLYGRQK